jgi:aminopeptidase YwaD
MSTAAGLPAPTVQTARLDALLAEVSAERMTATVGALASNAFTGRRVGTAGGTAARTWLTNHLTTVGATPTTEEFTVRSVPEIYRRPAVTWNGTALTFGRDVAVHLASADLPDARTGTLGGAGTHDPDGRWLVVPQGMSLFDAYGHAFHHTGNAAGLLLPRGVDADGWQFTMLAGPNPGPLPILTIETALHRHLLDAGGTLTADAPIRRREVTGTNLHTRLRPAAPGRPDLLLTAHYDGVGDHPGLRQPAAADNASGVAVVCEAARILAPALPNGIGLSVTLLDGEETGALGSAHHAARLHADGTGPWVINVDGAGCLHEAAAVEAGGPAHGLLAVLDQAGRHVGLPLAPGPVASDNRRYAAAGLAAIGIGAGMAGYHSPADTPERVEPTTLTAIARLVVAACWFAGRAPVVSGHPA